MRIRTVKPEFFTDEKVRGMEPLTQLLFVGLWCFADDAGRFEDDLPIIKAAIFPTREVKLEKMLAELVKKGMISRYKVGKRRYYLIRNWAKHQRIRNPTKARTPAPPRTGRPRKKAPAAPPGDRHLAAPWNWELGKGKGKGKGSVSPSIPGKGNSVRSTGDPAPPEGEAPQCRKKMLQDVAASSDSGEGEEDAAGETDGGSDGALLEALGFFFPDASVRKCAQRYPPERLWWAIDRARSAINERDVRKPASYLLRILRDEDQWERYVCDQYALGRAEALRRQKELALRYLTKEEKKRDQAKEREDAALRKYIKTMPAPLVSGIRDYALGQWSQENGIDLEKWQSRGWLLKRAVTALLEEHVRRVWLRLGKPAEFEPGHLELPESETQGKEASENAKTS